jgi:hypothetical protein
MIFVGKPFVIQEMQLQPSPKNLGFKCHVNKQYEEGFHVSGAIPDKKKI